MSVSKFVSFLILVVQVGITSAHAAELPLLKDGNYRLTGKLGRCPEEMNGSICLSIYPKSTEKQDIPVVSQAWGARLKELSGLTVVLDGRLINRVFQLDSIPKLFVPRLQDTVREPSPVEKKK